MRGGWGNCSCSSFSGQADEVGRGEVGFDVTADSAVDQLPCGSEVEGNIFERIMRLSGQGHLKLVGQHCFSCKLMHRATSGNGERSPNFHVAEVGGLEYGVSGDRLAV